jgi:hypothetical protein
MKLDNELIISIQEESKSITAGQQVAVQLYRFSLSSVGGGKMLSPASAIYSFRSLVMIIVTFQRFNSE